MLPVHGHLSSSRALFLDCEAGVVQAVRRQGGLESIRELPVHGSSLRGESQCPEKR